MTSTTNTPRKTKAATVNRMLRRVKGATLAEIERATTWKPHSCRAFLSGVRNQGITLAKEERPNGVVAYKMSDEAGQCQA